MRLSGKVAVVTGAGAGMGRAIAQLFAAEGARLVLGDVARDRTDAVVEAVVAAGGQAKGVVVDIAQSGDADALVQAAIDTYGAVDVLVNNAGINDHFDGAANFDDATYARVMGNNVFGPLAAIRAAVRHMKGRGGGSIVNAASASGIGGSTSRVVYTASQHALVGITRDTAVTYAPHGIRCNALVIGLVGEMPAVEGVDVGSADPRALGPYGSWFARVAPVAPVDVARVALFLASDEAKGVSGAIVAVDGGWTTG